MTDSDRPMERHKSLYFRDGNIVLWALARQDECGLLFRVHKSVLSGHSQIFMDLFDACSLPDGSGTSEFTTNSLYDGVPLIHMPDNADHLESVLKILYYQSTLPWVPRSPHYPELIAPILEMSRKYGIDRIREQIQAHIESDWPQTLNDWDRLETDIGSMVNDSRITRIDDHFPEPAAAIRLARQFDIPSILPAAFYHLSRLSILDDWDKTRADPPVHITSSAQRTAKWGLLSAHDFHCLLLGKAEFTEILRGCIELGELTHTKLATGSDWQPFKEYCRVGEGAWKDICNRCSQSADPLAVLKSKSVISEADARQCTACIAGLKVKIPTVREKIWEKLGDLFHLKE